MASHADILRRRASASTNTFARTDFKIWWFVRASGAAPPSGFPGDEYYSGIGYAPNLGIHSKTVQATVQSDWDTAFSNANLNYSSARFVVADWEGPGSETPTDMQNILSWLRSASLYNGTKLGIYAGGSTGGIGHQCALTLPQDSQIYYWTKDKCSASRSVNDGMVGAVTGTGDALCNVVCPELYFNCNIDRAVCSLKWFSSEHERLGIAAHLVPMINPKYPPGRSLAGASVKGSAWRGLLEAAIRIPNVSGLHIWHGDRASAWSESEDWFVETLDFINSYGLTTGDLP